MQNLSSTLNLESAKTSFFEADWPAPQGVKTLLTTRQGGVSEGVFAALNVALHVGDNAQHVAKNRAWVAEKIPLPVAYLEQVHGSHVVRAIDSVDQVQVADASFDNTARAACAIMTADCLPVLFCDKKGSVVAAAHAGWRGLIAGVLENTVRAMGCDPQHVLVYFGPAISADAFEVRRDVVEAFVSQNDEAAAAFENIGNGQFLADIYLLARQYLHRAGVTQIFGGERCTVLERDNFFSHRRDQQTGRMLSAVWLEPRS